MGCHACACDINGAQLLGGNPSWALVFASNPAFFGKKLDQIVSYCIIRLGTMATIALTKSNSMLKCLASVTYVATAGAILAAVNRDEIITWCGIIVALGSSLFSWGIGRYHNLRSTIRAENRADRREVLEDIRAQASILTEMRIRQETLRKDLDSCVELIQKVRCRYPNEDGSARCGNDSGKRE
jgi:hypothetical protein